MSRRTMLLRAREAFVVSSLPWRTYEPHPVQIAPFDTVLHAYSGRTERRIVGGVRRPVFVGTRRVHVKRSPTKIGVRRPVFVGARRAVPLRMIQISAINRYSEFLCA